MPAAFNCMQRDDMTNPYAMSLLRGNKYRALIRAQTHEKQGIVINSFPFQGKMRTFTQIQRCKINV